MNCIRWICFHHKLHLSKNRRKKQGKQGEEKIPRFWQIWISTIFLENIFCLNPIIRKVFIGQRSFALKDSRPEMNSTTALPTFFQGYSEDLLQFASMSCLVFMCIGVPGNLLTIMALLRCKQVCTPVEKGGAALCPRILEAAVVLSKFQRHQPTTIFVMNLSLSDLLFGLFNLPLASSTFLRRTWTYGDFLCRLYPLFRYGLLAVSLFTVSLITINRYVIIVHPRQYSRWLWAHLSSDSSL